MQILVMKSMFSVAFSLAFLSVSFVWHIPMSLFRRCSDLLSHFHHGEAPVDLGNFEYYKALGDTTGYR
jgi:hypothetical protein